MPVSTTEQQAAVDRFLAAIRHGDLQGLLDVLAPDVIVVSDGGGLVAAARRPIRGAEWVAGFLIGAARSTNFEAKAIWLNGAPACRIDMGGELDHAVSLSVENGRITRIYAIRNRTSWPGSTGSPRSHGPDPQVASLPGFHLMLEPCSGVGRRPASPPPTPTLGTSIPTPAACESKATQRPMSSARLGPRSEERGRQSLDAPSATAGSARCVTTVRRERSRESGQLRR